MAPGEMEQITLLKSKLQEAGDLESITIRIEPEEGKVSGSGAEVEKKGAEKASGEQE